MTIPYNLGRFAYGGDYNPEQWPREVWDEDMVLMRQAGVTLASVGIFSWAVYQPRPDAWEFAWMDDLLDLLHTNGVSADLATGTAAPPPWMSIRYPEMLPVTAEGVRLSHGSRQGYCPNSGAYREGIVALVSRIAERYKNHPALALWHSNNEYACHVNACYCDLCAAAFRTWLQRRYGDIDAVNAAWATNFWSQRYGEWNEIIPPRATPTMVNPGLLLDYRRFMSDSYLELYQIELAILRQHTPHMPVTTNFMEKFKPLDYFQWGKELDVVSWDTYPTLTQAPADLALNHDLMRGVGGGRPFLVMEQTPSQVQWREVNPLQRPGMLRLRSFQAVAHGADGICYFQWRRSRGGAEQFHGAVVEHHNNPETRVFREVTQLGQELAGLSELLGTRGDNRVALLADWPTWWAVEYRPGPSGLISYPEYLYRAYAPLHARNIGVDVVGFDSDLSGYNVLLAPLMHIVTPELATRLRDFVTGGGTLVTGPWSGAVDEHGRAQLGGYPGPLRELMGMWVEEFDPLLPDMSNTVNPAGPLTGSSPWRCDQWCEVVHLTGAEAWGTFGEDFYAGSPAITVNQVGQGRAVYVATRLDETGMAALLELLCSEAGVKPVLACPAGVEATQRVGDDGRYLFLLNHNTEPQNVTLDDQAGTELLSGQAVSGKLELPGRGVAIVRLG